MELHQHVNIQLSSEGVPWCSEPINVRTSGLQDFAAGLQAGVC